MPRPKAVEAAAPVSPTGPNSSVQRPEGSIVAAAAKVTSKSGNVPRERTARAWQGEVWEFLDTVGELRFFVQWKSNALSRVKLRLMHDTTDEKGEPTTVDVTDDPAYAYVLGDLFGGEAGQRQMLATMGAHLAGPGESYLVGVDQGNMGDLWRVLSNEECSLRAGTWEIDRGDGIKETYADGSGQTDNEALVIRVWRPHPRKYVEADSSVRAALPVLRELRGIDQHIAATIDSRLAGAGILVVPTEMTFETPSNGAPQPGVTQTIGADGQPTPPGAGSGIVATATAPPAKQDTFISDLTQTMIAALRDRGVASAVVPLVIKAPGALIEKIRHITFSTPFDDKVTDLRKEDVGRLSLSLDVPPEVLLGNADSNHWSAWLSSEDGIKFHVEPDVQLIEHSLTEEYVWPLLAGAGDITSAVRAFRVEGDTSELRQRPERSTEALELHKRLVLSDAALLRETGFATGDQPDAMEVSRRLLLQVAGGVTTADLTQAALEASGVSLVPKPSEVVDPAPTAGTTVPTAVPAPAATPISQPVRTAPEHSASILAASELLARNAITKGNNRLRQTLGKNRGAATPEQVDAALAGAWDLLPETAALLGLDPQQLQVACDAYARDRLTANAEHDRMALAVLVDRWVLRAPEAWSA